MKSKIVIWIVAAVFIGLLVLQQIAINNQLRNHPEVSNYELLRSIDSLKTKIDSLKNYRDSLQAVVDTNKVKIIEVEKRYETIRDRIINQSVDSDCVTFSNYISNYQGLPSSYNSTTIKDN